MRFLFCSQFYYPSVGGVQEVMRQIAERMVKLGHDVTVATTALKGSAIEEWNGVKIKHFAIDGNLAFGIIGEVDRYRDFVLNCGADAVLIKAAQQWTFDALLPILDQINYRKIFIPCGFSGLRDPLYKMYYEGLPSYLKKFDELIFYASHYWDIEFCRARQLTPLKLIPNGASEIEFEATLGDEAIRSRLGVPQDSFLFLTVGTITGVKGHREVLEAFKLMHSGGRKLSLVLNGAYLTDVKNYVPDVRRTLVEKLRNTYLRTAGLARRDGIHATLKTLLCAVRTKVASKLGVNKSSVHPLEVLAEDIRKSDPNKTVVIVDLPRREVVDLFEATDLFVFASNIEYSPLVLFEAAAAGTPFLTVPVGNSEEIIEMTQGGILCPAEKDLYGYTRVKPSTLAGMMTHASINRPQLVELGRAGRNSWREAYTWEKIALLYEDALTSDARHKGNIALPPKLTVLLPVYNGATTIVEAINSVLIQTYEDFELLVLDDGSTDATRDLVAHLKDPRIRLVADGERHGLAARLNEGIYKSSGEYIARMDADDICFPKRFEAQIKHLQSHPDIDLVSCKVLVFRDDGGLVGLHPFAQEHQEICAQPWRGFSMPHPSWCGKTSWFKRFRYHEPETARAEDQELLLRSYAQSKFASLPDVLLAYRQGPFNLLKTLQARRSLTVAQFKHFLRNGMWGQASASLAAAVVKCGIDIVASIPGFESFFFVRMAEPVPSAVVNDFRQTRKDLGDLR